MRRPCWCSNRLGTWHWQSREVVVVFFQVMRCENISCTYFCFFAGQMPLLFLKDCCTHLGTQPREKRCSDVHLMQLRANFFGQMISLWHLPWLLVHGLSRQAETVDENMGLSTVSSLSQIATRFEGNLMDFFGRL